MIEKSAPALAQNVRNPFDRVQAAYPGGHSTPEPTLSTRKKITLTVDGIADQPARFDDLQGAVDALRALLGTLRLDPAQAEAYAYFLGDGGADRVQDYLDRSDEFQLDFVAAGRPHTAVITRA